MLSQATLSLLTVANIIVAKLSGTFGAYSISNIAYTTNSCLTVMLPIFVVATNAPLCLALLVL